MVRSIAQFERQGGPERTSSEKKTPTLVPATLFKGPLNDATGQAPFHSVPSDAHTVIPFFIEKPRRRVPRANPPKNQVLDANAVSTLLPDGIHIPTLVFAAELDRLGAGNVIF